jgi:hypothetical protein
MKDYRTHLEALRREAAECALIRDLTTVPQKRELFAKLAVHLNTLAGEVDRAMVALNAEGSGITRTGNAPQAPQLSRTDPASGPTPHVVGS